MIINLIIKRKTIFIEILIYLFKNNQTKLTRKYNFIRVKLLQIQPQKMTITLKENSTK